MGEAHLAPSSLPFLSRSLRAQRRVSRGGPGPCRQAALPSAAWLLGPVLRSPPPCLWPSELTVLGGGCWGPWPSVPLSSLVVPSHPLSRPTACWAHPACLLTSCSASGLRGRLLCSLRPFLPKASE